jgi:serine/threonine protein kinase
MRVTNPIVEHPKVRDRKPGVPRKSHDRKVVKKTLPRGKLHQRGYRLGHGTIFKQKYPSVLDLPGPGLPGPGLPGPGIPRAVSKNQSILPPNPRRNDKVLIGEGKCGRVFKFGNTAVKFFDNVNFLLQETVALSHLAGSKYVLQMKEMDVEMRAIVFPLYETNLRQLLVDTTFREMLKKDEKLSEDILTQITAGLVEIHERNLIHGDLKPHNILANISDEFRNIIKQEIVNKAKGEGSRKLIYQVPSEELVQVTIGDLGFVSPLRFSRCKRWNTPLYLEREPGKGYFHDIYCLGMIFLELLGRMLIKKRLEYAQAEHYTNVRIKDKQLKKLVLSIVSSDKNKRPSAREILNVMNSRRTKRGYEEVVIREYKDKVYNKLNELDVNDNLYEKVKATVEFLCLKYHIKRRKRALYCSLIFSRDDTVEACLFCAHCVLIILCSNFGHHNFTIEESMSLINKNGREIVSRSMYLSLMQSMIDNKEFVRIIMSK